MFIKTHVAFLYQAVSLVDQHLHRRPHGHVALHGGVHGDQRTARGILQAGFPVNDAVQDRLAVLGLADLQVGVQIRRGNVYSFVRSLFFALLVGLFLYWLMPSCEGIMYAHFFAYVLAIIVVIIFWRKDIGLSVSFAFNKKIILESLVNIYTICL